MRFWSSAAVADVFRRPWERYSSPTKYRNETEVASSEDLLETGALIILGLGRHVDIRGDNEQMSLGMK